MKTLIELYDNNIILNISTAVVLNPENLVFICGKSQFSEQKRKDMRELLNRHSPKTKLHFYEADTREIEDICECLEEVVCRFEDCAIEINGGSSTEIFAAGNFVKGRNIPVFSYDPVKNETIFVYGRCDDFVKAEQPGFSIDDFALMAGGKYITHGHFDIKSFNPETLTVAGRIWKVFLKNKNEWHSAVNFFQEAFRGEDAESGKLFYDLPADKYNCNCFLLKEICRTGALRSFETDGKRIIFEIRNIRIKKMLCDYGVWLEIYVYTSALRSGKFDNVEMSVVLEWRRGASKRESITNEVDVVLTKGCVPYFISCKAGAVATSALNELKTICAKFGSGAAKAVLVTTSKLSAEAPKLYKRAIEMGIKVIELSEEDADLF